MTINRRLRRRRRLYLRSAGLLSNSNPLRVRIVVMRELLGGVVESYTIEVKNAAVLIVEGDSAVMLLLLSDILDNRIAVGWRN